MCRRRPFKFPATSVLSFWTYKFESPDPPFAATTVRAISWRPHLHWTYKFESADSPSADTPTTLYCVISCLRNCRKTGAASALVKMSACCSFVGTHLSTTSPCSTDSVTK